MQKHEVTDREEANEKVKYEPGGGAKTKRKKISEEMSLSVSEDFTGSAPGSLPVSSDGMIQTGTEYINAELMTDTFSCKLCNKGFEAFIPYLNHLDDHHYKNWARNSLRIKDEFSHDFEKLFSAAQRAKDVVNCKTKVGFQIDALSSTSDWMSVVCIVRLKVPMKMRRLCLEAKFTDSKAQPTHMLLISQAQI